MEQIKTPRANALDDVERTIRPYGISLRSILSKSRNMFVVRARDAAFHLLRHKYNMSYKQIGNLFSKDHTSVLSGIGRHDLRNCRMETTEARRVLRAYERNREAARNKGGETQ